MPIGRNNPEPSSKKPSQKKRRSKQKTKSKQRNTDKNQTNSIKNTLSNRYELTLDNISSLRWDNVLNDPILENNRIEQYKELRRQRYIEAQQKAIEKLRKLTT